MDGEERVNCACFTSWQTYEKEWASFRIFASFSLLFLSLLFLCSTPMLKMFCDNNYLTVRKHMENLLDDHEWFYCSKLPLEKRAVNLECSSFYKYQLVHQSCAASWKLGEKLWNPSEQLQPTRRVAGTRRILDVFDYHQQCHSHCCLPWPGWKHLGSCQGVFWWWNVCWGSAHLSGSI